MKLPFDCKILDKGPVEVANPFSGEKVTLQPEAVAVYDTIKGAEIVGDYDLVRKGIKHIDDLRHGEEERNVKYDRCCY